MSWWETLGLLFGLLTLLMLVGVPAAFAFLAINLVGAVVFLGGQAGLMQVVRNGVASITNFSLTPIPFFVLMGEVLFHTGIAMRAIDAFDNVIWRVPGRLARCPCRSRSRAVSSTVSRVGRSVIPSSRRALLAS